MKVITALLSRVTTERLLIREISETLPYDSVINMPNKLDPSTIKQWYAERGTPVSLSECVWPVKTHIKYAIQ